MADNEPTTAASDDDQVLVVMTPGRDRDLLVDWLGSLASYEVATLDPGSTLPEAYDVCLLDRQGLSRGREALRRRSEAADPVFLPHLLVAPTDDREDAARTTLVDDVVEMPVEQAALQRRIENLLQARRASVRLAEREEQYQQLVELTPEPLLLLREGSILYGNAAAVETFDDGSGLGNRPVTALVTDDSEPALADLLATIEQAGRSDQFAALSMCSLDGDDVEAEVAGVSVTFDGEPAVQLLVRDVTATRERQQRLDLFGRAIDAAAQGITIADIQQDDEPLIYVNDAFARITGYPVSEALGRNCRFLQGEHTDEEAVARLRRAIDAREPTSVEILNYRKDGTPFWNRLEIVPVAGTDGTVTHYLGLQRDITERKQREERLAVMDRVLRHNIRNRMNVVRSYADVLRNSVPESNAEALDNIVDAADDLINIAEQVRRFQSIITAEERELEVYDLASLASQLANGVRTDHPEATIRLDLPETAEATVHATLPAAVEQVLLLANGHRAGMDVTLRVTTPDDHVRLELIDHGDTIPREELLAIARERETSLEHSQGLELWLVRWAVRYSEGNVDVRTTADGETSLSMRFQRPN